MFAALKKMVTSMKFWTAVFFGAVVAGMKAAGASDEVVNWIGGLGATLIGAQGVGEFGTRGPQK